MPAFHMCWPVLAPSRNSSVSELPRARRRTVARAFSSARPYSVARSSVRPYPSLEEEFRALLAAGADPCAALDSAGNTLLHPAVLNALEELVTLLLSTQVG